MLFRIYVKLTYKNKNTDKPFDVRAMSESQAKDIVLKHCKTKFKKAYLKIVDCNLK